MQIQRVRSVSTGGIISTYAGNGILGYSGDGGLATSCEMYNPYEMAVDNGGNLFICDRYNHRVRRVDFVSGIITTVAGTGVQGFSGDGGAAASADLNYPSGVHVDNLGNIYIADQQNHRIRKVSGGIITTIAGIGTPGLTGDGGPATLAQLYNPHGICLDALGNIYIADSDNNCVRRISTSGTITTIAGNGTAGYSGDGGLGTLAQLTYPTKVDVNNAGHVYVADFNNHAVRVLIPTVGIEENYANNGITTYPNPSDGIVNVSLDATTQISGFKKIFITNMVGEVVWNNEMELFGGTVFNIDISALPSGMYLLTIGNSTERIIKK